MQLCMLISFLSLVVTSSVSVKYIKEWRTLFHFGLNLFKMSVFKCSKKTCFVAASTERFSISINQSGTSWCKRGGEEERKSLYLKILFMNFWVLDAHYLNHHVYHFPMYFISASSFSVAKRPWDTKWKVLHQSSYVLVLSSITISNNPETWDSDFG